MARFVPRSGFPFGVRSFEASQGPVEGATPETVVVAPAGDAQAAGGQQVVEVRPVQTAGDATADGGGNAPAVTVVAPAGEAIAHAPGTVGANLVFSDDFATPNAADYDHSSWVPGTFVSDGAGHLSTDYNDYGLSAVDTVVSASPIGVSLDLTQGARAQMKFHVEAIGGSHIFDVYVGAADADLTGMFYYASATIISAPPNLRLDVGDATFTGPLTVTGDLPSREGWVVVKVDGTDAVAEVWDTDPSAGGTPVLTNTLSGIVPADASDRALFDAIFTQAGSWVDDFQVFDGPELGSDSATVLTEEGVPTTTVTAPSGQATAESGQQTPAVTPVQTAGAASASGGTNTPAATIPQSAGAATASGGANTVTAAEVTTPTTTIVAPAGQAAASGGTNAVIPFEAPTVIRGGGQPTHIVTVTAPAGEAVAEGGENRVTTQEIDEPRVRVRRPRVRQRGPRTHPHLTTTTVQVPAAVAYAHAGTNAARTTETVPLDILHKQDEEFEELLILGLV